MNFTATLRTLLKSNGILFLLYISIGVSITALGILLSLSSQQRLNREMVIHTYKVLQQTEKVLSLLKDAETGQRGFLLTGEDNYLEPFSQATTHLDVTLSDLKKLTEDNAFQQEKLDKVGGLVQEKMAEIRETINLRRSDGLEAASAVINSGKGKLVMNEIREIIKQLEDTEKGLLAERNVSLYNIVTLNSLILWITTLFSVIIIALAIRTIRVERKNRHSLFNDLERNNRNLLFNDGSQAGAVDEVNAVNNLIENLTHATAFIQKVGAREYDAAYPGITEQNHKLNQDNLAGALLNMREQMKKVANEEQMRYWANEGEARFGEILRKNNQDMGALSQDIVANLVKYLKANQGGLFLLNDEEEQKPCLELVACYAFDRKKFIQKRISIGEGLVGQAFQEKDVIHLTDIPNDYINITSGLGKANPTSLLIVPLQVNEQIYGVIELASFNTFAPHEIAFVRKLSESIAATISSVKMNEKTRRLLELSQQQAEEMRAAEEEMRQNMEELQATQEALNRRAQEQRQYGDFQEQDMN
jgi:CHASE3 domain sensor protein/putative methionine-R-sulfoxide reductase with GAF domain